MTLKHSVELGGIAESGDNPFWVFVIVDIKMLISAALNMTYVVAVKQYCTHKQLWVTSTQGIFQHDRFILPDFLINLHLWFYFCVDGKRHVRNVLEGQY